MAGSYRAGRLWNPYSAQPFRKTNARSRKLREKMAEELAADRKSVRKREEWICYRKIKGFLRERENRIIRDQEIADLLNRTGILYKGKLKWNRRNARRFYDKMKKREEEYIRSVNY